MESVPGPYAGSHYSWRLPATTSIVSGERILHALHTAANLRQARGLSDEDVRCALAIAEALGELAAEQTGAPFRRNAYASADLALDRAASVALGARSGATPRQVDRGLELLLASQVLLRVPGRAEVRLSRECMVDIPPSRSGLPLVEVRESLVKRRAALMPGLAVLRYLRELAPDPCGWVVSSLEQATARTFFKRSTVARALVDLESIGAIERARGPGLRGHYRIVTREAATGPTGGEALQVIAAASDVTATGAAIDLGGLVNQTTPSAGDSEVLALHEEAHLDASTAWPVGGLSDATLSGANIDADPSHAVVEIGGVAFPIPPGTTLVPEFDRDGRMWYRLGTARIGPIKL